MIYVQPDHLSKTHKSNNQWQFCERWVRSNNVALSQLIKSASFTVSTRLQVPWKSMRAHNDCWKNSHFPVLTSSKMHLSVSVCATFTHERSIIYNIMKRLPEGNLRVNDITRVSRQSLRMEVILAESQHVQSLHTISWHPDGLQQQKLARCVRNWLVNNLM